MTIVFASSNAHKIKEINAIVPKGITVLGLADIGITAEIPETSNTIKENSMLKARFVFDYLKQQQKTMPVFADDSGLEVDALNGEPGVFSARYAGTPKNDANNNQKLLQALKNVSKRNARFVTVITLLMDKKEQVFEGEVKGTIAYEARGTNGFGYDPLFIPQSYRSTFAQLSAETKNSISHRALAMQQLLAFLKTID